MFLCEYLLLIKIKFIGAFFPWIPMTYVILINIGICMWNTSGVSRLGEKGCVWVEHLGQHICFGATSDIVTNRHINVIKETFTKKHWLHGYLSYRTYKLCPIITFLAFKNGLATNNHIGLLIVRLIINIFPFHFQTGICYVLCALIRHHNLLVLTHCKLMTIKPQFFTNFNWNW